MTFIICFVTESYSKALFAISVITSIIVILINIYYFVIRNKSLKYSLISGIVMAVDLIFPFFFLFCISYYETFGLLNFVLLYFLPFLLISFSMFMTNVILIKRKNSGKPKRKTSIAFSGSILAGATIFLSRGINLFLSTTVSENLHFLLIAYIMLLLMCIVFSGSLFDLLCFYYYIKLEKLGLVTEDVLKPEE